MGKTPCSLSWTQKGKTNLLAERATNKKFLKNGLKYVERRGVREQLVLIDKGCESYNTCTIRPISG
jgi:hypothetical protein